MTTLFLILLGIYVVGAILTFATFMIGWTINYGINQSEARECLRNAAAAPLWPAMLRGAIRKTMEGPE